MLYIIILVKMYGTDGGMKANVVFFTFSGIAAFLNILLNAAIFDPLEMSWNDICRLYGGFCCFALFILLFVYKGSKT